MLPLVCMWSSITMWSLAHTLQLPSWNFSMHWMSDYTTYAVIIYGIMSASTMHMTSKIIHPHIQYNWHFSTVPEPNTLLTFIKFIINSYKNHSLKVNLTLNKYLWKFMSLLMSVQYILLSNHLIMMNKPLLVTFIHFPSTFPGGKKLRMSAQNSLNLATNSSSYWASSVI